jgi:hypothetical protein
VAFPDESGAEGVAQDVAAGDVGGDASLVGHGEQDVMGRRGRTPLARHPHTGHSSMAGAARQRRRPRRPGEPALNEARLSHVRYRYQDQIFVVLGQLHNRGAI